MNYFVYVLRSQSDGKLYIGSTKNLIRRLKDHQKGKVRSTKSRRPFSLVYYETLTGGNEAIQRERFLKSGEGRRYLYAKINPPACNGQAKNLTYNKK